MLESNQLTLLLVAIETELACIFDKQLRGLRGMGIMAAQAITIFEGRVLDRPSGPERLHFMTLETEGSTFLSDGKRLLCCRSGMTRRAFKRSNRFVNAGFKQLGLGGTMRIMADQARFSFHRIVGVALLEGCVFTVVAAKAKGLFRLGQQVLLVRAMCAMTSLAPFFKQHLMHDLLLKKFLLVAAIADCVSFGQKHSRPLRTMSIVTLAASASLERRMDIGLGEADLVLGMAIKTNLVAILFQQKLRDAAVTNMTALALFLSDDRMQIFQGEILVRELGVTVRAFLGREFLRRRMPRCGQKGQNTAT